MPIPQSVIGLEWSVTEDRQKEQPRSRVRHRSARIPNVVRASESERAVHLPYPTPPKRRTQSPGVGLMLSVGLGSTYVLVPEVAVPGDSNSLGPQAERCKGKRETGRPQSSRRLAGTHGQLSPQPIVMTASKSPVMSSSDLEACAVRS